MTKRATPIDVHVGSRVRLRRQLMGITQEQLATSLGVTFQQVQKYERGVNRIGASRLLKLSEILDVPLAFFFEDLPGGAQGPRADDSPQSDADRATVALVRELQRLPLKYRTALTELARSLISLDQPEPEPSSGKKAR